MDFSWSLLFIYLYQLGLLFTTYTMPITFENLPRDYEELQVPVFILKGRSDKNDNGLISVSLKDGIKDFFPVQYFQVTNGYFKAMIYLNIGVNQLSINHIQGEFQRQAKFPTIPPNPILYDSASISINYNPMQSTEIPKIHLCLMLGKDSPGTYDCPRDRASTEGNSLDIAIRKLKMGGRIMQAFTQDEMFKNGFGNRSFRFVEEKQICSLSKSAETQRFMRDDEIKVHVIRCDKTVAEINSYDMAQQNPKAKDSGGLFSLALDTLTKYGGAEFDTNVTSKIPAQAAVIFLDSHWDGKFITGHAALGGGTDRIKLAIFGSHGIHCWPTDIESLHLAFTDTTQLSIKEVANDCNQCSSNWECLSVTLGAFMHEIGHSLGCPHQESGVMLRDYITMNRKFVSFENDCIRTKKSKWGPTLTKDEPGWHRLDILRFLYHSAFQLPKDYQDESIKPVVLRSNKGMKVVSDSIDVNPQFTGIDADFLSIQSDLGTYLVEVYVEGNEFPKLHYEYLPLSYRGIGPQRSIKLSYSLLQSQLEPRFRGKKIKLEALSCGFGQSRTDDLKKFIDEQSTLSLVKLEDGSTVGVKFSNFYGEKSMNKLSRAVVYHKEIIKVRVTHGFALDGIEFFNKDGSYQFAGNAKSHYSDFFIDQGDSIVGINVRSGLWVDAIQFVLKSGRTSPMFGNTSGGSLHRFTIPEGMIFAGLECDMDGWINRIRVIYSK